MGKAAMGLDFDQIHGKDTVDLAPAKRDQSASGQRRGSVFDSSIPRRRDRAARGRTPNSGLRGAGSVSWTRRPLDNDLWSMDHGTKVRMVVATRMSQTFACLRIPIRVMVLLIDNYDSFTYNLVQRIGELDASIDLRVVRHDKLTCAEAEAMAPSHVIVSPGPCTPREAGVSPEIVTTFAGRVPLLGVCLGHQCIGHAFGMTVDRNHRLMHGKTSPIQHDGKTIFAGMSNPFTATRYHSLVVCRDSFDQDRFELSAWTKEGEIMGLRARDGVFGPAPLEGVQFHPESFLTDEGPRLLANFLGIHPDRLISSTTAPSPGG